MRRPIAPIACALALITGAWFGQAYSLFGPPGASVASNPDNHDAESAVWRFYDAVDVFLRTGDNADLLAAVSPEFVDHAARPGLPPTRDGLVRYLATLPVSFPDLRLTPSNLLVQDDRVVAQVNLAGVDDGSFLGIPLSGALPWASVDIFRVRNGQIVEHWGEARSLVVAEPLLSDTITVPPGSGLIPLLERITLAPGAADDTRSHHAPAVVMAESGEVDVTIDAALTVLSSGDGLVIPADIVFAIRNRTDATAVAVVLRLKPTTWPAAPGEPEPGPETPTPGITTRVLAKSMAATIDPGMQTVAFGRVALAPGAQLPSHQTDGSELLVVEEGRLTAIFPGDSTRYWVHPSDPRTTGVSNVEFLTPPFGLSVSPNAVAAYRNDDATVLSLLVVTIAPSPSPGQAEHEPNGVNA